MHTEELRNACRRAEDMVVSAWRRGRRGRQRPLANYASKAAHPCVFFLWASRVMWEEMPEPDDGLLGVFRQGEDNENAVIKDMQEGGFNVAYQQVLFEDRALQIRGRTDGFFNVPGDPVMGVDIPFDAKGLHPGYAADVKSFADCLNADKKWLRLYPGQVLLYADMPDSEDTSKGGRPYSPTGGGPYDLASLVCRDKSNRKTTFIIEEVENWRQELTRIASTLRSVNWYVSRKKTPKPMNYDPVFCDGCGAAHLCPTMMKIKANARLVQAAAPEVDRLVSRMVELKPMQLEFGRHERKLKSMLNELGYWQGEAGAVTTLLTDQFRVECTVKKRRVRLGEDLRPLVDGTQNGLEYSRIGDENGG